MLFRCFVDAVGAQLGDAQPGFADALLGARDLGDVLIHLAFDLGRVALQLQHFGLGDEAFLQEISLILDLFGDEAQLLAICASRPRISSSAWPSRCSRICVSLFSSLSRALKIVSWPCISFATAGSSRRPRSEGGNVISLWPSSSAVRRATSAAAAS